MLPILVLKSMSKRQTTWDRLQTQMSGKRTRVDAISARKNRKGSSCAPHEIIVQRLASEPDNKQTFKPVQPREFVNFEYGDLSLANLKKACAAHFKLPASTCDVLVSNKGPSCSNILQIPHRKDKVYLVRFVVVQEEDLVSSGSHHDEGSKYRLDLDNSYGRFNASSESINRIGETSASGREAPARCTESMDTQFPASVSIDELLKAGKLVKPTCRNKVMLTFEKFDVQTRTWSDVMEVECAVESEKFSSGAFRDAYHATLTGKPVNKNQEQTHWVVKTYNAKATKTITETLKSTIENHCRKQVQMHTVAKHLAKKFQLKAPPQFGECFHYNRCYYTTLNEEPATVEEFVPGTFVKYINNNGKCVAVPEEANDELKQMSAKAQCLVHYSYNSSEQKLMLLDIQGSGYHLYDPEIATNEMVDTENQEVYFCCGNCSSVGIQGFLTVHTCNKFCEMMGLEK